MYLLCQAALWAVRGGRPLSWLPDKCKIRSSSRPERIFVFSEEALSEDCCDAAEPCTCKFNEVSTAGWLLLLALEPMSFWGSRGEDSAGNAFPRVGDAMMCDLDCRWTGMEDNSAATTTWHSIITDLYYRRPHAARTRREWRKLKATALPERAADYS
jgi:hypothetical protein